MPTVGIFHATYWNNSDTNVVVMGPSVGGYPAWQASPLSMVMGTVLGGAEPIYQSAKAGWLRFWWAWLTSWRIRRLDPERKRVLGLVIQQLHSTAYPHARVAVRMTATTIGLNEPAAWKALSHDLHKRHMWAENMWRHLHACDVVDAMIRADGSTITNQNRTLVTELAYRGFATSNSSRAI